MVCIGHYESGLETDAVGTKGEEGSHDHGLFQANKQQKNSKFVNIVLIDLRFIRTLSIVKGNKSLNLVWSQ